MTAIALATVSPAAGDPRWWLALGVAAVVLMVVVILLEAVRRTARRIRHRVSEIWTVGTHIAANTITIGQLERTNFGAGLLLECAGRIATAAERIRRAVGAGPGATEGPP